MAQRRDCQVNIVLIQTASLLYILASPISISLFFYAYWDIRFLPLLVISVAFNWLWSKW
jgi:hypothetical protein